MRIALLATDDQWEELQSDVEKNEWLKVESMAHLQAVKADIYLNLYNNAAQQDYSRIAQPVIINSVVTTLKELNAGNNIVRINGWNSFLVRSKWELAGNVSDTIEGFFTCINKECIPVPDEPGFIAARIISMIINEAYYAIQENISTKEEINTAMKLGTNYPYGPFEWSDKIGIQNIFLLLQKLSIHDKRYVPATSLQEETI